MKNIWIVCLVICQLCLTAKSQVVINEIYGGGGNSGSDYKNDFIELFNNSSSSIDLTGWSVQYASSAGTTWQVTILSGSIAANGYFLIQEAKGAGGTTNLPVPDNTGTIAMSASAGKVALVNSTAALTGSCPTGLIDFAGYGGAANCFEGTGPAPAPSNTTSVQRTPAGTDTQNNSDDFIAGMPGPVNAAGPDFTAPEVITLIPANADSAVATSFTASINFNEPVIKGSSGNIVVKRVTDNNIVQTIDILASSVIVSGADVFFPVNSLALHDSYYIQISNTSFRDVAGNDFGGITGSSWTFTTSLSVPLGTLDTIYDFNTCGSGIPGGFTFYNNTGAEVWSCTTFGRDPLDPAGTASFESAVQINGFNNGTNVINEDWLISPSFDLTVTSYPLLSFWSRTAFNGRPLQLKVSTDYQGTGDPANYTWVDIDGRFPVQGGNIWSKSESVNLAAYKSAHTYFAFVYHSSTEDGARWTVDDIVIHNSPAPPAASLTTSTPDIGFGYVPVLTTAVKDFTFTGNDLTGDVVLTASGNYLVAKTPGNFTTTLTYTQAEANDLVQKVYVQFLPLENNVNYAGSIALSTAGASSLLTGLTGNSINDALTLEVVNWNLEWFGSADPALGPTSKAQQEANVKIITQHISADLFAFAEVVSETALQNVVANLNSVYGPGMYNYVISNYGSHTNPFEAGAAPLSGAQKEAFVYKASVISPIEIPSALVTNGVNTATDLNNPAYNYFSSGRYPYMMYANVTLGGVTKPVRFVLLHAKANTSPTATSYNRRKAGADTLNYTLNTLYPGDNIVLLGDFNDDLDQSITAGFTISSYSTFNDDAADFSSPTLALSIAGKKSTVSYNDMIDHVELSNEMQPFYMQNSARVLSDVGSLVSNYGSTTTDHYPVFTRYAFDALILPVTLTSFAVKSQHDNAVINWSAPVELNTSMYIVERSADSRNWIAIGYVPATGSANNPYYSFTDHLPQNGINYYRLKQVDADGEFRFSGIKTLSFYKSELVIISPNPTKYFVDIRVKNNSAERVTISVIDSRGKVITQAVTTTSYLQINTTTFSKGIYLIKVAGKNKTTIKKLIIQ